MLVTLTREQRDAIEGFASLDLEGADMISHFAGKGDLAAAETAALRYLALVRLLRSLESTADVAGGEYNVDLPMEDLATLGQYLFEYAEAELGFYSRWIRGEAPDFLGPFDSSHDGDYLDEHLETRSAGVTILEAVGKEGGG